MDRPQRAGGLPLEADRPQRAGGSPLEVDRPQRAGGSPPLVLAYHSSVFFFLLSIPV